MVKKNSNPKISAATQKVRPKRTTDLQNQQEEEEEEERNEEEEERDEEEEEKKSRHGKGLFHACYLLTSLCPRFKGHTYIGYTVNPRRRIRQHNGEIRCGAFRTKKRRPWEMVLCLYGFPSNVSALQFEWAWQHPTESLAVRQAAATFKSFSGVANKIKLAYTMLNLPAWQSLNITVNYFSTKYTTHSAGCPRLPEHMNVHVRSMEELPCYTETDENSFEGRDAEIGWYGEDEHQETGDAGKAVNANVMELQAIPVNLSARTASAILSSFSTRDTQEKNMITLIEGSDYELDWSGGENRRSNAADPDEVQPSIRSPAVPRGIEVIDLVSPSTECRIMRTNKKRRISVVCPVIDLT